MIHQRYKNLYHSLLFPFFKFNLYRYRYLSRWRNVPDSRLHLGCGDKYLPGFINIDVNCFRKSDMWLDLRYGLPFTDNSVQFIYCSHTLEHFYPDELQVILKECYRVLITGGGLRIVVPNLRSAIKAYMERKYEWFGDWPRSYESMGGRFSNFIIADGQHLNAFDFGYFEEVLKEVNFSKVVELRDAESILYDGSYFSTCETENSPELLRSLYIEAIK